MILNLIADLRFAVRGFLRRPLFSTVVVLTLAFAPGHNVAMSTSFAEVGR